MADNDEKFATATHLYVRLKRAGRVIDPMWMSRDPGYARDVLEFARTLTDPEIQKLADRFDALGRGGSDKGAAEAGARASKPAQPAATPATPERTPPPVKRYTGSLR